MFNFLGFDEIALVVVILVLLFNSRDLLGIYKFLHKQYLHARRFLYRTKAELLYEPPTKEELQQARETEEFYQKYSEEPEAGQPAPPDTGTDRQNKNN